MEEIILVDDASEQEHLGSELEDYVKNLPLPVSVLRTGVRSGLIRARWEEWRKYSNKLICTFFDSIQLTLGRLTLYPLEGCWGPRLQRER